MSFAHHCPECEIDFTSPKCPMCGWQSSNPNLTHEIEFDGMRFLVDVETAIIIKEIMLEVARARDKWPSWHPDRIHAAAIVAEEAGELIRATIQERFQPEKKSDPRTEAIQTAAMCIRFLTGE